MTIGEWDQRELCPDGGCVGVIGPDGTCKVCGRAAQNWGDERKRGLIDPPDEDEDDDEHGVSDSIAADGEDDPGDDEEDDDEDDEDDDDEEDDDEAGPTVAASSHPSDWGSRLLCPDGTCIGLIGSDGRCKVCGRAAAPADQVAGPAAGTASPTEAAGGPVSAATPTAGPDWNARVRCGDSACAGAIGPDGRCEVCGKVAA